MAYVGDTAGVRVSDYLIAPTPPPDIDIEAWQQSLNTIDAWQPVSLFLTHFGPVSPARAHLARFRTTVAAAAETSREMIAAGGIGRRAGQAIRRADAPGCQEGLTGTRSAGGGAGRAVRSAMAGAGAILAEETRRPVTARGTQRPSIRPPPLRPSSRRPAPPPSLRIDQEAQRVARRRAGRTAARRHAPHRGENPAFAKHAPAAGHSARATRSTCRWTSRYSGMAAPASHSTNTPASLISRVVTDAKRTAPDASFQVMRAGTVTATRSDDRFTRFP